MCDKGDQVVMELPDHVDPGKEVRTISADRCCVDVLKHLWSRNIDTRGHCCGHGERNPNIVLPETYHQVGLAKALYETEQVDDRQWDIFQWQLVKVN